MKNETVNEKRKFASINHEREEKEKRIVCFTFEPLMFLGNENKWKKKENLYFLYVFVQNYSGEDNRFRFAHQTISEWVRSNSDRKSQCFTTHNTFRMRPYLFQTFHRPEDCVCAYLRPSITLGAHVYGIQLKNETIRSTQRTDYEACVETVSRLIKIIQIWMWLSDQFSRNRPESNENEHVCFLFHFCLSKISMPAFSHLINSSHSVFINFFLSFIANILGKIQREIINGEVFDRKRVSVSRFHISNDKQKTVTFFSLSHSFPSTFSERQSNVMSRSCSSSTEELFQYFWWIATIFIYSFYFITFVVVVVHDWETGDVEKSKKKNGSFSSLFPKPFNKKKKNSWLFHFRIPMLLRLHHQNADTAAISFSGFPRVCLCFVFFLGCCCI